MLVYLETSALNYFCDEYNIADAIATKALQREKGRRWAISPVTIWEVLLTADDERKERLIRFAQHFADAELLPSPEELLVKYVEQGCPLVERKRSLVSQSHLTDTWRDLCECPDKTFIYDRDDIVRRTRLVARTIRDLHKLSRDRKVALSPYSHDVDLDITLEQFIGQMSLAKDAGSIRPRDRLVYRIALFYIFMVMCAGAGVDSAPFAAFWKKLGIDATIDRCSYVLKHLECLVYRGPFVQMAQMTLVQSPGSYSRGLYWDSLHCAYLPYVSWFLAEDEHFQAIRAELIGHPFAGRIHQPSKMVRTEESRPVHMPPSYIIKT
jgi:hypothetical protein